MIIEKDSLFVTKPVSEICKISLGGTPRTGVKDFWDGEIKWITAKDISKNQGRYISESERRITKLAAEESNAKVLPKDTIVITSRGTVGKIAILQGPMSFNQTCYGLNPHNGQDALFVYYALKNSLERIRTISYGTVFQTITIKTFSEIEIPNPPIEEQQAIAKILSDLDSKIELNQQTNKTLESIAQAIFKHWFIDFEFPNEEGKPYKSNGGEMVGSEIGKIPERWKVDRLEMLIDNFDSKRVPLSSRERAKKRGPYPYYGATKIVDYVDDFLFDGVYLLLGEDGTVIDNSGNPILQYVWNKFWVNNHAHVLTGKGPYSTEFVYLLLKNENIGHIITGAVQLKINQSNLNNLRVIIPPNNIVKKFEEYLKILFTQYRNLSEETKNLEKIKDLLLPKLMSGKIRVPLES